LTIGALLELKALFNIVIHVEMNRKARQITGFALHCKPKSPE
jgi:hypothetical protein